MTTPEVRGTVDNQSRPIAAPNTSETGALAGTTMKAVMATALRA